MNSPDPELHGVHVWRGGGAFRATAREVYEDTSNGLGAVREPVIFLARVRPRPGQPGLRHSSLPSSVATTQHRNPATFQPESDS